MATILVNPFYVSGGGGASTLLTGLVSWWDLTANGNDSHGSNNLSNSGTPSYGTVGGYSAVTTSETDHLYAATPTGLGLSVFSLAAWVYITTFNNNSLIIHYGDGVTPSSRRYTIEANNSTAACRVTSGAAITGANTSSSVLTTSTWKLIIGTYDDSTGSLDVYVDDGTNSGTSSTGGSYITSSTFGIGIGGDGDGTGSGQNLVGSIKSAAIWNRVITSDERTELWNSGVPLVYADL